MHTRRSIPKAALEPPIDSLLAQFQKMVQTTRYSSPSGKIAVLSALVSQAQEDPEHPLRRLVLMAESSGYDRAGLLMKEIGIETERI